MFRKKKRGGRGGKESAHHAARPGAKARGQEKRKHSAILRDLQTGKTRSMRKRWGKNSPRWHDQGGEGGGKKKKKTSGPHHLPVLVDLITDNHGTERVGGEEGKKKENGGSRAGRGWSKRRGAEAAYRRTDQTISDNRGRERGGKRKKKSYAEEPMDLPKATVCKRRGGRKIMRPRTN